MSEHTLLDTPQQVELFRLLQVKYGLKIQMRTGLRHSRGSLINLTNEILGTHCRTAATAYEAMDAYIAEKTKHLIEDPA